MNLGVIFQNSKLKKKLSSKFQPKIKPNKQPSNCFAVLFLSFALLYKINVNFFIRSNGFGPIK